MSTTSTPPAWRELGPYDRQRATRAVGLLAAANAAAILHAADVHVASRLCHLLGEPDEQVALALALAVRAVRTGSVALDLSTVADIDPEFDWPQDIEQWRAQVAASAVVRSGTLVVDGSLIYLERYHDQEVLVAHTIAARRSLPPPVIDEDLLAAGLERLFPDDADADQRAAAELVVREPTAIITGGPGTGKTTTIAKVLALLAEQYAAHDPTHTPRFALAAPTAKAAGRLSEAFHDAARRLPAPDAARLPPAKASTLHRLLGRNPASRSRFQHHRESRLPHDVVVIDEASMVSLTMMARLLEALRPSSRLLIVGDPDQLTSVEAGAVLADLVSGLGSDTPQATTAHAEPAPPTPSRLELAGPEHAQPQSAAPAEPAPLTQARPEHARPAVARLRHTYRFGGEIDRLAQAIREGDAGAALAALATGTVATLVPDAATRRAAMVEAALRLRDAAGAGDAAQALAALADHRLLCAHRTGPFGVSHWNRQIEQWLSEETGENHWAPMYAGRPLLVTTNDYAMDLYNGDTGVVLRRDHGLVAVFDTGAAPREVAAARLADVETMFAATVHKSQGSQARHVTVILPEIDSPLLTRELIYTAVTRSQDQLTIIGSPDAIERGLSQRIQRASGLAARLREVPERHFPPAVAPL